jgi:GNAT superfamily N-acetyltransferase
MQPTSKPQPPSGLAEVRVDVAAWIDREEIFDLVNAAYSIETGDTGLAFKNCHRLLDSSQEEFSHQYNAGQVLKVCKDGRIQAVIFYKLEHDKSSVYFGPFATRKECAGKGYGRLLIAAMEEAARKEGLQWTRLVIVNHRTDMLSMYTHMGFELLDGTLPYLAESGLTRPSHFLEMRRRL